MSVLPNSSYHEFESSVSPKGQITLPSLTRRKFDLKAKDKVIIKVFDDGRVLIEPSKRDIYSFYQVGAPLKEPLTTEEMREIAYTELYEERLKYGNN